MRTEQLIEQLAARQLAPGNPELRIAGAMAVGCLVALAGMLVFLGPPLQHVQHTGIASFAVKLGYTLALASLASLAAISAGRPGRKLTRPIALIALPFLVLTLVALLELFSADAAARPEMLMGTDYKDCLLSVVLASLPIFVGLVWAYRILAPTRPPLAGFLIGLSAGAAGAMSFTLYCHEAAAAFLFAAYTPAILVPALLGAFVGRSVLKW